MVLQKRLDYGFNGYQAPPIPRSTRSTRKKSIVWRKADDSHMFTFDLLANVAGNLLLEGKNSPDSTDTCGGRERSKLEKDSISRGKQNEDSSMQEKPSNLSSCEQTFFLSELVSQVPMLKNISCEPLHAQNDALSPKSVITSDSSDKFASVEQFVSSDNSVKLTLSKDHITCGSCPVSRDNVKLGNRDDDDENSSGLHIGDQRSGKLLGSEYSEVNPKSNDDVVRKHVLSNKKNNLNSERSLRDFPFKKRKLYNCSSLSKSDKGTSNDGVSCSRTKGCKDEASCYTPTVKLKIKSFKVPELFIEIPETSTIGSLKRTVMEAVTEILGGGLRVGVLFEGNKVRDDNKTLLQTGISGVDKPNTLDFSLEPIPSKAPTPQPTRRYCSAQSVVHNLVQKTPADTIQDPPRTNMINFFEIDHDSAPSTPDTSFDKSAADSRAIVSVPAVRKTKQSEAAQRRIRRPFSVSEVEALVQAVERLGTGRWRDVKLRVFDNAKHRTYVDLKDKWKTLVHTARISPQQRRGEQVPQELLDRVLIAHAYWSQQQAKQQMKQHVETCLLL